ncbi:MAG: TIGR04086 family membrane protein [Ruminococcaceae bacterium]|nr:TIGR04086 family membrane protein [Oscillospiraceae bacterium]
MKIRKHKSRGLFLSCVLSQGIFLFSSLVLLLIFCAISSSMEDPDSITTPLSLCALYLGSLIGGFSASKLSDAGIISGLIAGVLSAVIIFAMSAFPLPSSGVTETKSLILTLIVVPISLSGAFIGKKRAKKPKRRNKRYS